MASSEPLNLIASIVDSTGNAVPVLRAIRATGSRVFSIVADASMPMSLRGQDRSLGLDGTQDTLRRQDRPGRTWRCAGRSHPRRTVPLGAEQGVVGSR